MREIRRKDGNGKMRTWRIGQTVWTQKGNNAEHGTLEWFDGPRIKRRESVTYGALKMFMTEAECLEHIERQIMNASIFISKTVYDSVRAYAERKGVGPDERLFDELLVKGLAHEALADSRARTDKK